MRIVPSVCRCAMVVLVVGCVSSTLFAQSGGSEAATENPFGFTESPAADQPQMPAAPSTLCHCIGEAGSEVAAKINKALATPLMDGGIVLDEEPLESVINFLQAEFNIPIHLDVAALEDVGLSADEPITISVQYISLKSALRLMLKPYQLTYIIRNEVLIITTPDGAALQLLVCVYDVRDLVDARNTTKELEQLVDVIFACFATDSWAVNGGGLAEIRPLQPGLLVVSQTRAVHEEIQGLLAALRKILHRPAAQYDRRRRGEGMMGRGGYEVEAAKDRGSQGRRAMGGMGGGYGGRGGEAGYGGAMPDESYGGYGGGYGGRGGGGYAPQQRE